MTFYRNSCVQEIADIPPKEFEEDLLPVLPVPQAISTGMWSKFKPL